MARAETSDGIDLSDVARTIRLQWRAVIAFVLVGTLAAVAVVLFAPRRYEGRASLLARSGSSDVGASILGRLGSVGELVRGGGLGGAGSQFESEIQLLRSRAIIRRAVDSLQLQFLVRDPRGRPALDFVSGSALNALFAPRTYRFERQASGAYRVQANDSTYDLVPGTPGRIDIGTITLRSTGLPKTFALKVLDGDDAVTRVLDRLGTTKAGGEVARVVYHGEDSITAAAVPNLILANYLERRKTVDRGVNARRVEYVTAQVDSVGQALAARERELREYQERSGVLDAEMVGKAHLEAAVALRESLTVAQVEEGVLRQMLAQNAAGTLSTRQLAAYPAFIRGTTVSALANQLSETEAQRTKLLERRTERDPEVMALDKNIADIESQILGMTRSYTSSVAQHRANLAAQVDSMRTEMLALPVAAERGGRMTRDITRLTAIYTALQAQLVDARLAAISEGGEVRPVDFASVPRKPAFPEPWSTMGIGTVGGFVMGLVAALFLGWFGRWFRDPVEIERATGIAVQRLQSDVPLLINGRGARTLLVAPIAEGAQASTVAQRVAHTATSRAVQTNVLDLSGTSNGTSNPAALIDKLEGESAMLVVQLPDLTGQAAMAALRETRPVLLVAPPGPVDRGKLGGALDLLQRAGVPCAGVVISDAPTRRIRG